jgi:hypothetical protein
MSYRMIDCVRPLNDRHADVRERSNVDPYVALLRLHRRNACWACASRVFEVAKNGLATNCGRTVLQFSIIQPMSTPMRAIEAPDTRACHLFGNGHSLAVTEHLECSCNAAM